MQCGIDDDAIVAGLVRNVVGDEYLLRVEQTGEGERVRGTEWKAKVPVVVRNLAIVHATESERLMRSHDLSDFRDFFVNFALSVEQAPAADRLVEHGFPHVVIPALASKTLLCAVVHTGRSE